MPPNALPFIPPRGLVATQGALLLLAIQLLLLPIHGQENEFQINVIQRGAGKFSQTNITKEENKVIQAAFAGGNGCSVEALLSAPDGTLYLCGNLGGKPTLSLPFTNTSSDSGNAFVARVSGNVRTMQAIILLPKVFQTARCLALAPDGTVVVGGERSVGDLVVARLSSELDRTVWTRSVTGDKVVSISVAPDNSVIVCPDEKPFVSRIASNGSGLIPFGSRETFRTDAGNPDILKAWWEGCGYPAAGYKGGATYHRGGSGGVVALRDGTFVLFTTNFLHHPGGGPDFDPMLLKFDTDGKILWCTNLLEGLPAEADQKEARMSLDPYTGDLLLAAVQHGHFSKNLIVTPGAVMRTDNYLTGNIMIGWIARVDPTSGKPKSATFYFPEMPGSLVSGKKRANSLFPQAQVADATGNIYVTGRSAYKFSTSLHAFQSDADSGAFLSVFTPGLDRLLYASLVSSTGYDIEPRAIAVAAGGPVFTGHFAMKDGDPQNFVDANTEVTNYLIPRPTGPTGALFSYHPSTHWKN